MTPSSVIGHYRIVSKLGEGGMGAVYRAVDTKLNREVAIKVLPDALANDPDYLERFTREAQVLASLNHPNIATIHGVEDRALVMELVPGQTLQERIDAGPIPLEEAVGMARQIAEALEAAHDKGVIHRDLKPANVKVTPEGVVKVLDFGLAKAADPVSSASGANSPTLTIRATQAGLILGTAGYMAPEQAAGKVVDRRADIWSFGVLLYELLTGKRLFTGETISHTLASVLKDPIDFDIPQAPPPIRRLLARCLTRNPKDRLRDIGEARIAIGEYLANPVAAEVAAPVGRPSRLPWIASAALLLALAASVAWNVRPSPPLPVTRSHYMLPEGQVFTNTGRALLAISPDGSLMVYVADRRLYLRSMSEWEARPITGSESAAGVTNPVFSPDGKSLIFFENVSQTLKRLPVSGGTPATLCPASNPLGVSWSEDGILFTELGKGILRVSPNGGQPELLVAARKDELLADARLLPGGEAVLFGVAAYGGGVASARWENGQVIAQTLKSGARKVLVEPASAPRYLPTGHLIYGVNGVMYATTFNPRRLETGGRAVPIVEGVARVWGLAQFVASDTGTLLFLPGPVTLGAARQDVLGLVDRNGEVEPLKVTPGAIAFPRVSRDGRVAYQIDDLKESSIWVWQLSGDTAPRRLTLPGTGVNRYAIWSSDGQRVAYQSDREGDLGIWWQRADGSGVAERLTKPEKAASHIPDSWSPDGQTFSYTEEKAGGSEVWTYSLREKKATLFAAAPGEFFGRSAFSPDGRWMAYQASAQPHTRMYVRPFPPTATAYVAPEDADSHHPLWSPDGKTLFYVAGAAQFGWVSVSTEPSVNFGHPVRAPRSGFLTAIPAVVRTYDILPDGKRFIGVVSAAESQASGSRAGEIRIVQNWFEDVKQRVSGK
jgi:Tol biopolymer transport system component